MFGISVASVFLKADATEIPNIFITRGTYFFFFKSFEVDRKIPYVLCRKSSTNSDSTVFCLGELLILPYAQWRLLIRSLLTATSLARAYALFPISWLRCAPANWHCAKRSRKSRAAFLEMANRPKAALLEKKNIYRKIKTQSAEDTVS